MYITYFSNKPHSEIVVDTYDEYFEEIRKKIGAGDMVSIYLLGCLES
jgi:hypothetical protein